ncbi:MAG: hypothetical protein IPG75_20750 [Gemmatimonadetes bacterium]|nr:hypothetical protein [Gemmatimonadota bacterium]
MQALTREQEELLRAAGRAGGQPSRAFNWRYASWPRESADAGLEALVKKIIEVRDREAPATASA